MDDQLPRSDDPWGPPPGATPPPPPPPPSSSTSAPLPGPTAPSPSAPVQLPDGPPSPWAPGAAAAGYEPPRAWTSTEPSYVAPAAPKRRRGLAIAVAAAVLAAGGVATALIVRKQSTQAVAYASPEDAVRAFVKAVTDRDILGAVEALAPPERNLMLDVLDDWRSSQTKGAPTDAELRSFDGYTLSITDLKTTTFPVTDDISVVELNSGAYAFSLDARGLPFVSGFAELVDDPDAGKIDTTGNLADDDPLRLATTRDGDGWHVSLFYSLAEAARSDSGLPAPDPAERIEARGADSPEAAVREMIEAAASTDFRRVIELTTPTEMAVLHDYGALLLREAPEKRAEPFVTISRLELEQREARNATILTPKAIAGSLQPEDELVEFEVTRESDDCWHFVVRTDGETTTDERSCKSEGFGAIGEDLTDEQKAQLEQLQAFLGVAAQQVDGAWYVSPGRTIGRLLPAWALAVSTMGGAFMGIS